MHTLAIVLDGPGKLSLKKLGTQAVGPTDVRVAVRYSGVSTGTEKLLWTGRMPAFPGMGYPLVPGYESVGTVVEAGSDVAHLLGASVFVPGANCYEGARGLFGGAAASPVLPASRVVPLPDDMGASATLLALAATARHCIGAHRNGNPGHQPAENTVPDDEIGKPMGGNPRVWEIDQARMDGADGYSVTTPQAPDPAVRYTSIADVSGASDILDHLVPHLAREGEIMLGGFYDRPLSFSFPPAFRAEARIRIAAEFTPADLVDVVAMVADGRLRLDGLVTHVRPVSEAADAYPSAFEDRACLKMVIDWREAA